MRCSYIKKNGGQCEAQSIIDSDFCFFHDPKLENEKKEAQIKGGQSGKVILKSPLPIITISKIEDVTLLLSDTINRVRSGEMDVKIANCLGVLSGQLIKAFETAQIENRVEVIEREILERKTTYNN
ncbi:MAG: hypothetical protein MUF50_04620 [Planctomycetes bacterium]|jgi:hypothetical protein|nr:hypothetical protein [Planctomycetota bacterium]